MRTKKEIQLLNLRQKYRDYLVFLGSLQIIPIAEYRQAFIRFQACNWAVQEYRAVQLVEKIAN